MKDINKMTIVRECDKCGKEDSISCVTGLCPSCDSLNKIKPNYKKAYNILIDWFDCIPEEDRAEVSEELEKVGC